MYKIYLRDDKNKYELNELVKMFLKPSEFQIETVENAENTTDFAETTRTDSENGSCEKNHADGDEFTFLMPEELREKNAAKRFLYDWLHEKTGKRPLWGTLTGVRPGKLAMSYLRGGADDAELARILKEVYYISDEKIELLTELCRNQQASIPEAPPRSAGVYIGIPFCPTRCLYCSFTSNQASADKIAAYLEVLHREIAYTGDLLKRRGITPESFYIGGGTPTTLTAEQLSALLACVRESFDMSGVREFTVEAGRPDTITEEKLDAILAGGAGRISINPQTMKAATLERIGRSHTPEQIVEAFRLAKKAGVPVINADLIAGLPGEDPSDFEQSLKTIMALAPENLTVHTLAVKKASRLIELDADYSYRQGETVSAMLAIASALLREGGYLPYYLYRQKHMAGNLENTGYALPGTENLYNVRIMGENQTIAALGAGGISKVYFAPEDRLERVPNVSNYEIYMERIEEMLMRKEKGIL